MRVVIYQGIIVHVMKVREGEIERLILDAKRIMGLHPALYDGRNIGKGGGYLTPPAKGSDTWKYARNILDLKEPIVKIWDGQPRYVSGKDVKELC